LDHYAAVINRSKPPALTGGLSEHGIFWNRQRPLISELFSVYRKWGLQCKALKVYLMQHGIASAFWFGLQRTVKTFYMET